jgi:hypothetical protein
MGRNMLSTIRPTADNLAAALRYLDRNQANYPAAMIISMKTLLRNGVLTFNEATKEFTARTNTHH